MRDGLKIVCVTPAGRRRYMRLLVPYVLSCPDVDRYDFWVNTDDAGDLAFLEALEAVDPRIRLLPRPDGTAADMHTIKLFYPHAMEPDAVYVRLDDDVVWIDPAFFETLLAFRLAHPEYFTVAPLIVNNALCTFLLQSFGRIVPSRQVDPARFDAVGWVSPSLARALHGLLQELILAGEAPRLACGRIPLSANVFSINCISWFGRDIAALGGMHEPDEEAAMSGTLALKAGRFNAIETGAMAAHFAFLTQRHVIDRTGLLEGYDRIAAARPEVAPWRERVDAVYTATEARFPTPPLLPPPRRRRPLLSRLLGRKKAEKREPRDTVTRGPTL